MPINNFLLPGAKVTTAYEVANSCRFNDGDAPDLTRSKGASETSLKKGTFSFWIKRAGIEQTMIYSNTVEDDNNRAFIQLNSDHKLRIHDNDSSGDNLALITTQLFRDPSAWSNFVIAFDTTQGTAANRVKIYYNGTQITAFDTETYPAQDIDLKIFEGGQTNKEVIGGINGGTSDAEFYLAEFVFIDGTQNAVTDFGEFNEDSPTIWQPIDVSGLTFGNTGFYLDFEDSDNLGDDESGNTSDFTENNLASTDQTTDTPTNNFCTLNPLYKMNAATTFSEGNCKAVAGSGSWAAQKGTMAVNTGKWYWEIKLSAGTIANYFLGVQGINVDEDNSSPQEVSPSLVWYNGDASIGVDGSYSGSHGALDQGDIMGIALDMDAGSYGQVTIYDNNSASVSNVDLSSAADYMMPFGANVSSTSEFNFGGCSAFTISSAQSDENGYGNFEYAPPSGYLALCTKNLATDG